MQKRLIPVLLLQNRGLIKTVKFAKPKYVGDPVNAVKIFNEKAVDELVLLDIYASKEKRKPDLGYLEDIVSEAFMPIGYGGGIIGVAEMAEVLKVGIEKIIVNHQSFKNIQVIEEAAKEYGSSTIVGSMDVKKDFFGRQKVFVLNGEQNTKYNPLDWAKKLEQAGVGELFLNVIDKDGTYTGYDVELVRQISEVVQVPVIACGGAGSLLDVKKVLTEGKASAAAAGSIFCFYGPHKAVLINYPNREDFEAL